ncbi:MAG: GNAT family N-acetyltransferase [Actinomycetota bacterium]|nr:GNAT family N-acetyltransferase [Actinomycetota bacterium]
MIRTAGPADAVPLASIHHRAAVAAYAGIFPPDPPAPTAADLLPDWEALIADPEVDVLVAERRNANGRSASQLIGGATVEPDATVPTGWKLGRLYVDPDAWGTGAGSSLHDAALDAARRRGATRINLWVLEANTRARTMYEQRSWVLVPGRTLPNDPPWVLDVLYERTLP